MATLFERTLPSRYELLSPLADEIQAFLELHVEDEDLAYRTLLLSTEAMTNAMEHGNNLDPSRMALLYIAIEHNQIRVSVEDEGPGFDVDTVPDAVEEGEVFDEGHRGLFLMRAYAQEVTFENGGRRIVLTLEGQ